MIFLSFLLIQAAAFRAAVREEPALAQAVIGSLSGQFRRMVRQIKNLELYTVQRVGCYILDLSRRQGTPERATLPYEKNLIASKLGITRESFSRALSTLHRGGDRRAGRDDHDPRRRTPGGGKRTRSADRRPR